MKCPSCNTINRDDRTQCYHCNADLSILRTLITRAKHNYNTALEHAERGRNDDAIAELKTAISIYNDFPQAHNVLGTIYAKQEKWEKAIEQWQETLNLDPTNKKASDYIFKTKLTIEEPLLRKQIRLSRQIISALAIVLAIFIIWQYRIHVLDVKLKQAQQLINESKFTQAYPILESVATNRLSFLHKSEAIRLQENIDKSIKLQIDKAKGYFTEEKYEEGLEVIKKLKNIELKNQRKEIDSLEHSLYGGIAKRELQKAQQLFDDKDDYRGAKNILDNASNLVTGKDQKEEISKELETLSNKWAEEKYKLALQYQQKKDYIRMEALLVELQKEKIAPSISTKIQQLIDQSKKDNTKQLMATAKQLIDKKRTADFLKLSTQIDQTYLTDKEKEWLNTQITKAKAAHPKSSK